VVKKSEFTVMVGRLILWIDSKGWYPLLDYAKRSRWEQNKLYLEGKSKCDGVTRISRHQYGDIEGFAVDIIIMDENNNLWNKSTYDEAHEYWCSLGGESMLKWDWAHWEVV